MRYCTALCLALAAAVWAFPAPASAAVIGKAVVTAEQASVMQGKEAVASVKKGDVLDVTEVKGDWFGVAPTLGWIHKSNVRFEAAAAPPSGSTGGTKPHDGQPVDNKVDSVEVPPKGFPHILGKWRAQLENGYGELDFRLDGTCGVFVNDSGRMLAFTAHYRINPSANRVDLGSAGSARFLPDDSLDVKYSDLQLCKFAGLFKRETSVPGSPPPTTIQGNQGTASTAAGIMAGPWEFQVQSVQVLDSYEEERRLGQQFTVTPRLPGQKVAVIGVRFKPVRKYSAAEQAAIESSQLGKQCLKICTNIFAQDLVLINGFFLLADTRPEAGTGRVPVSLCLRLAYAKEGPHFQDTSGVSWEGAKAGGAPLEAVLVFPVSANPEGLILYFTPAFDNKETKAARLTLGAGGKLTGVEYGTNEDMKKYLPAGAAK